MKGLGLSGQKTILRLAIQVGIALSLAEPVLCANVALVWPKAAPGPEAARVSPAEPHLRRHGQVEVTDALQPPVSIQPGDTLEVGFFEDARYIVEVDSIRKRGNGGLALAGTIVGHPFSTFTLTSNGKNFLMTLQDLKQARRYRVVGRLDAAFGRVTEIDVTKVPPSFDQTLLPPNSQ